MTPSVPSPADIRSGVTLRHYKGGLYRVVGLCRIEATLKTGVLYQTCQGDEDVVWMRPLAEFSDVVTAAGAPVPRFTVVAA
ncbi:DUF1653 domain-containing protein [Limnohabitans sp.]|jgi:hypothetical protein|uniref:DUF1653 domain-containing protein n=1 Tax=Limnohabitans sp. TaxID=1907725 RepID=UPI00391D706C